RKDKRKEKSKEKPAAARSERPAREQKPREAQPTREQRQPTPRADANRAPDEFRDDDVDNFGNRADYVSPYQNKNNQSRGRRPGAPAQGAGTGA
ncbi:DEAD/DEAH box helicase, partial [Pseudomonas sp. FSL A6-1183]|nr:DEAD/DEAH box helicase [Pseudomonas sp. FSL A6-1183]